MTALRINLGCGQDGRPDWLNADRLRLPSVDLVLDLQQPHLPFRDGTVSEVLCLHVLEHVADPLALLREVHRVLQPGGRLHVEVPHFSSEGAYGDFTHQRYFSASAFMRLMGPVLPHCAIGFSRLERIRLGFHKTKFYPLNYLLEPLLNLHVKLLWLYERTPLRVFPAETIQAILVK